MWVLLIYLALMIGFDFVDYGIGAMVSNTWGDPISLPVFLFCYFATLYLSWVIAVRIAEKFRLVS